LNERKKIAMDAHMDGQRVIARNIGRRRKLSEMELIVLCSWAKVGLYGHLAETIDGPLAEQAAECRREILAAVDADFGLAALAQSCAAMLHDGPLATYVHDAPLGEREDRGDG
jgi:hypothetical protein